MKESKDKNELVNEVFGTISILIFAHDLFTICNHKEILLSTWHQKKVKFQVSKVNRP